MRSFAFALAWVLAGCGVPVADPAEGPSEGLLQLGRESESGGVHYTLSARFDVRGLLAFELDTDRTPGAAGQALAAGSYVITIRRDFSLWRDVAVAQLEVPADLVSDEEQRFEIVAGASTLIAYEFVADGAAIDFESL